MLNVRSSRVIIGVLVVAILIAGGYPLIFHPRQIAASGSRPSVTDGAFQTSGLSNTITVPTTPTGVNNVIVLSASYRTVNSADDAIQTASFSNNDLTFACRGTGDGYTTEMWYFAGVVAGSYDIAITWNAQVDDINAATVALTGADTGNPLGASACEGHPNGFSNTPTASLTSPNDYGLEIAAAATYTDSNSLTPNTGSHLWGTNTTNVVTDGGSLNSTGGVDTFTWTANVDWAWATAIVDINGINNGLVRGTSGDSWADLEIGRRDFTEIGPGLIDGNHVYAPGGVVVDTNIGTNGFAYVWDSQNSRILGINLDTCYAAGSGNCTPQIVFGQPSADDHGGCNLDSSFTQYPDRGPASASTLCGIPEWTHTVLEDKSFTQMYVDPATSDLYVYDTLNNRILKYNDPVHTDTIADDVWGQTDFSGNKCNFTGGFFGVAAPAPTDSSLCFMSNTGTGAGINFDADGNMWVADGGNNRVLRFPNNEGSISHTPDLVLGQADFTTGGDNSAGSGMNRMSGPKSVAFDQNGRLYVADSGNKRLLYFDAPFSAGMSATGTLGDFSANGIEEADIEPSLTNEIFTTEIQDYSRVVREFDLSGTQIASHTFGNPGGGEIGFDANGALLVTTYIYGQNVTQLNTDGSGGFTEDFNLFAGGSYHTDPTGARIGAPGWPGLTVIGNRMYVSEGRITYWDNAISATNGQAPDGYIGGSSINDFSGDYGQLKKDNLGRLWAVSHTRSQVDVFDTPIGTGDSPAHTISSPINLLGGGTIAFGNVNGIAPTPDANYLWITDWDNNRILRVHNPLTDPVVDVILGQTNSAGADCNRGGSMGANTICMPGTLSLDRYNDLYVSDNSLEASGNLRMLMFLANTFPDNPGTIIYAPAATKIMNKTTFEVAFDSSNRMYTGYNPYTNTRFIDYYDNPTRYDPNNSDNQAYAVPNGHLNDFENWVIALTTDDNNNLYGLDANRGRVLIYQAPRPQDAINPTIGITSPVDNASPSGVTDVTVNASDNQALVKVVYDINGTVVDTAYTAPFSGQFNADDFASTGVLTATAYDGAGNIQTSSINLNFAADATPPSVSITSPTNNQQVTNTVTVTTDASDNVGIDHVKLFVDGSDYATVSNSPFNFDWDTTTYAHHSSHTLVAQAFDAAGNNTNSTTINAVVLDTTPPTGAITLPVDGAHVTLGSRVTITATASDNGGLNRVDFYVNGIRKCAATSVYTCTWNVPRQAASYTLMAKILDSGGNITNTSNVSVTSP